MKIALASYRPEWHDTWSALEAKLTSWVTDAASQGADLLVFPEYAGVEAALIGKPKNRKISETCAALADKSDDFAELNSRLARESNVHILSGSLPAHGPNGLVNRATLCAPSGAKAACDKLIPTPYERGEMNLTSGTQIPVFETTLGTIAVLICYDSEFPLLVREAVEGGADLILVPSCTDLPAGQTRVRQSCRARAIEGQCLVAQAPLVGSVPDCEIVDINVGQSGVFCPPDHGWPANGIVAEGTPNVEGWLIADLDLGAISKARKGAQVGNRAHWPEQSAFIKTALTQRLD